MGDKTKWQARHPEQRKQVTNPTRLAPWGGPAQNDSQDVQWGSRGEILRRGTRHDLARLMDSGGRIGCVVSCCVAARMGPDKI